jgi:type II secretory pathway component GspD/PulD (secretin)
MENPQFVSIKTMLLAAALAIGIPGRSPANEPVPEIPPMVEIQAQFFYATDAQVRSVFKKFGEPENAKLGIPAEELDSTLEALRKAGASFFSSPRLVTNNGQRAMVESVRELKYPTEFEVDPKSGRSIPTGFETRNVGVTVEIEPCIAPGDNIGINIVPSVVSFLGFIDYDQLRASGTGPERSAGADRPDLIAQALKVPTKGGNVVQPIFASSKVTTCFTVASGRTVLLGGMVDNAQGDSPAGASKAGAAPTGASKKGASPSKRQIYVIITPKIVCN